MSVNRSLHPDRQPNVSYKILNRLRVWYHLRLTDHIFGALISDIIKSLSSVQIVDEDLEMSSSSVILMIFYDGEMSADGNKVAYGGGKHRPIRVPSNCKLDELKRIISCKTDYSPNDFRLKLKYKFPSEELIFVDLEDDEICDIMLEQSARAPVSVYVEKEAVTSVQDDANNGARIHSSSTVNEATDHLQMTSADSAAGTNGGVEDEVNSPGKYIEGCGVEDPAASEEHSTNTTMSEFSVGDLFTTKENLISTVSLCFMRKNHQFRTQRSSSNKLTLICLQQEQCRWKMGACRSKKAGAWKITSYHGTHSCHGSLPRRGHKQCSSAFICNLILPLIRERRAMTPREIQERIEAEYGIKISYWKAWQGRRKAVLKIQGTEFL